MKIEDYPDFKVKGIMIDIGRDKIPSMQTLYRIVDMMANLKLNQLQLYIEGFPFAYSSFPQVWQDGPPITGEEIIELDRYCRERFFGILMANLDDMRCMEGLSKESLEDIKGYIDSLKKEIDTVELWCDDAEIVREEFRNAIRFISHGINLGLFKMFMETNGSNEEKSLRLK